MDVLPVQTGRIQEIRAIDADNDVDLDVAVANQYASSALFANAVPLLGPSLHIVGDPDARSVAWGDADTDGFLDLLAGGVLYSYDAGSGGFVSDTLSSMAQTGAFGDFNGDGYLDVVLGTPTGCEVRPGPGWEPPIPLEDCGDARSFAWADYDDDGVLDLAAALPTGASRRLKRSAPRQVRPAAATTRDPGPNGWQGPSP